MGAVALACTQEAEAPVAPTPRIILLISIDTLRADHLGAYGHPLFTSPVLDAVALDGVVFEDASATASWTLPSHASMLTGLHPVAHGVLDSRTRLPDDVPTLASILGEAGWGTAAAVGVVWLGKDSYRVTRDFGKYLFMPSALARRSSSTWVTDQVIEWLDEAGDERIFVFAHYYDVHADYASEPAYEKLFSTAYAGIVDGTGWQLKQAGLPEAYVRSCHEDFDPRRCSFGRDFIIDDSVGRLSLSASDVRRVKELYDAQIRQLDTELGRLFAALRRRGLMEETLLVITSDHGEEFMEHGGFEHFSTAYQESIRVPLIFRGTGVPSGVRVAAPVSIVDIVPTLLAAVGVQPPGRVEGLDLAPLWRGGSDEAFAERHLFVEAPGGSMSNQMAGSFFPVFRSVRRGGHKLVVEASRGTHALYDLESDPAELRDLASERPLVATELLRVLEDRHAGRQRRPDAENRVDLAPEDLEQLRALGYQP